MPRAAAVRRMLVPLKLAPRRGRRPCSLDLGVLAAHDARHADGLVLVADAEHTGVQLALGAVQGADGLALARGADDDVVPSTQAKSKACIGWPYSIMT